MNKRELENLVRTLVEHDLARENVEPDGKSSTPVVPSAVEANPGLKVITEMEVRDAGLGGTVRAAGNAIVTAAAADLARAWGVTIQLGSPAAKSVRRIAVGSDHAGFEMKQKVIEFLNSLDGIEVLDLGTHSERAVDYPDFAQAVAEAVAAGKADLGIMVDGAGIGSAIAANKVPGIRAAMCYDAHTARNSREHNFANVLTLGGRTTDLTRTQEIIEAFLETPTGEERHAARVRKIIAMEKKYSKR